MIDHSRPSRSFASDVQQSVWTNGPMLKTIKTKCDSSEDIQQVLSFPSVLFARSIPHLYHRARCLVDTDTP
jgi:hypothetical protein